jgi:formylglycine-generating enzyme required for sulfatase activity
MVLAYSSPPREVRLAPFLLSKYEVTQEQWRRVTGTSPSKYERPGSPVPHPVEQVDWRLCARFCLRLGLELPSEDAWEYAARAGADTRFWTGPDLEDLEGAANVADRTQANVTSLPWVEHDPIDDGHAQHSPVGILAPNAFGLHDVHGNVWEWCLDAYSPVDGSRVPEEEAARSTVPLLRGYRGGSFNDRGYQARLGNGLRDIEGYQTYALGLRPALRLDRP